MSDELREGTGAHMIATRYTVFCSTCGEIGETTSAIRHVMIKQEHIGPNINQERGKPAWSDRQRAVFQARARKGHETRKANKKG